MRRVLADVEPLRFDHPVEPLDAERPAGACMAHSARLCRALGLSADLLVHLLPKGQDITCADFNNEQPLIKSRKLRGVWRAGCCKGAFGKSKAATSSGRRHGRRRNAASAPETSFLKGAPSRRAFHGAQWPNSARIPGRATRLRHRPRSQPVKR